MISLKQFKAERQNIKGIQLYSTDIEALVLDFNAEGLVIGLPNKEDIVIIESYDAIRGLNELRYLAPRSEFSVPGRHRIGLLEEHRTFDELSAQRIVRLGGIPDDVLVYRGERYDDARVLAMIKKYDSLFKNMFLGERYIPLRF